MEKRDFFISYSTKNEDVALWISKILENHGYKCYLMGKDCLPGINFIEWINDALNCSLNFIAVWSEEYEKSGHCMLEYRTALNKTVHNEMSLFLPVIISKNPVPSYGNTYNRINFYELSKDAAEIKLINAIERNSSYNGMKTRDNSHNIRFADIIAIIIILILMFQTILLIISAKNSYNISEAEGYEYINRLPYYTSTGKF